MKYFKDVKTIEDLKKQYYKLAMEFHPDKQGSTEAMQEINNEYDELFPRVKNIHVNVKGETYTKQNDEAPEAFKNIISELLKMHGIHIEVIGTFVWISGDTKPHKEELKKLGARWHSKKQVWYIAPEGYRKSTRKQYTMNQIREMYGLKYSTDTEKAKQIA